MSKEEIESIGKEIICSAYSLSDDSNTRVTAITKALACVLMTDSAENMEQANADIVANSLIQTVEDLLKHKNGELYRYASSSDDVGTWYFKE
ncbi:MAG: hypothetical protein ACOCQD_00215 [archaeon]